MRRLLFLVPLLCFVSIGLFNASAYAAWPYTNSYTASAGDTILASHSSTWNSEHINNNIPESIDDYSATVSEMGSTSDPYASSTEVQATTLSIELQQLRYQLDFLISKFNTSAMKWYHDVTDEGVLWTKGADVASASALPLINDGLRADVTGTTTITSMDSVGVGTVKCLQFDGALIITHHATNLVLPNGVNITTIAGDRAWVHEYAAGDWELVGWVGHELTHTHADVANGGNTLTVPAIGDFTNANHTHASAAQGGSLSSTGFLWANKTGAYTAVAGDGVFVGSDTAAITITLPATPSLGDEVAVIDQDGNAATNNITIARNGSNIMGLAEDLTIDNNNASAIFVYSGDATDGWRLR